MAHCLCMVTGMTPLKGAYRIKSPYHVDELAASMVQEVCEVGVDLPDLQRIISAGIQAIVDRDDTEPILEGMNDDEFFDVALVIGRSDILGDRVSRPVCTLVRRVVDYDEDVAVWRTTLDDETERGERDEITGYGSNKGYPLFVWERPFKYLEQWILMDPRMGPALDFSRRFYDMVDPYRTTNTTTAHGLLPFIDYGGIERSWDGVMNGWQDWYCDCRRDSRHLAAAISEGKRGEDLCPAIVRDCRAWMMVRPDIWPTFEGYTPALPIIDNAHESHISLFALPVELLFQIFQLIPLQSLLTLTATSKYTHRAILPLLDTLSAERIRCGDSYWMLPVASVDGEIGRFIAATRTWLPEPTSFANAFDVLSTPEFPCFAFVRACYGFSDSMRNRRRIWNIAQQYGELWKQRQSSYAGALC